MLYKVFSPPYRCSRVAKVNHPAGGKRDAVCDSPVMSKCIPQQLSHHSQWCLFCGYSTFYLDFQEVLLCRYQFFADALKYLNKRLVKCWHSFASSAWRSRASPWKLLLMCTCTHQQPHLSGDLWASGVLLRAFLSWSHEGKPSGVIVDWHLKKNKSQTNK